MKDRTAKLAIAMALGLSVISPLQAATPNISGVYLTAADYTNGRLSYEGDCKSKAHRLELHDVLNKPYIDVTHESQKRRFQKSELFGFRACDGRTYRFGSKFEYQILESRDLFIYSRKIYINYDKIRETRTEFYLSVGPDGPILAFSRCGGTSSLAGSSFRRASLGTPPTRCV